jgi:hypothetical protein
MGMDAIESGLIYASELWVHDEHDKRQFRESKLLGDRVSKQRMVAVSDFF